MIALWLALTAQAGPEQFPLLAELDLPAQGITRFTVPLALRSADDPPDQSDLWLVDATGAAVPVAWLRGEQGDEPVLPGEGLDLRPLPGNALQVTVSGRPLSGVRLPVRQSPGAIAYTVETLDGAQVSGPHLVWSLGRASADLVPLPASTGSWVLRPKVVHGLWAELPRTGTGSRRLAPHTAPHLITVQVGPPTLSEDGYAWYELPLPSPLPVRRAQPRPLEDVFEREAHLVAAPDQGLDAAGYAYGLGDPTVLTRVNLGGSSLDDTWLPLTGRPSDLLRLYVRTEAEAPLTLPEVVLEVEGLDGVVRDPGPGPHRLYGGAPPGSAPPRDLQVAAYELASLATQVDAAGEVQPNPDYSPPEVSAGVVDPGPPLSTRGFRWTAPVTGGPGLVRIPLPEQVLVDASDGLGDLRLVDNELRQIPYFLRRRAAPNVWADLPMRRSEQGSTSLIEVDLPTPDLLLSAVTLHTPSTAFRREVAVGFPGGGTLTRVRSASWWGTSRPDAITLGLQQRFANTLVIEIDNGDNGPLPISGVDLAWPRWELVAHLPEGEVNLLYGHRRLDAPQYDLELLRAAVDQRATREATLGAASPIVLGSLSGTDAAAVYGGLAVLVLGLGALLLQLLRTPAEAMEEAPKADAGV